MNQLVLAEAATSSTYNFVNALAPCVAKLDGTDERTLATREGEPMVLCELTFSVPDAGLARAFLDDTYGRA